jgi:hypothetical protein
MVLRLAMIASHYHLMRNRAENKHKQCEKWTYSRLIRLVLLWSATASSFAPTSPIKLLERLLACGHEPQA